jgi:hypothetical protein
MDKQVLSKAELEALKASKEAIVKSKKIVTK